MEILSILDLPIEIFYIFFDKIHQSFLEDFASILQKNRSILTKKDSICINKILINRLKISSLFLVNNPFHRMIDSYLSQDRADIDKIYTLDESGRISPYIGTKLSAKNTNFRYVIFKWKKSYAFTNDLFIEDSGIKYAIIDSNIKLRDYLHSETLEFEIYYGKIYLYLRVSKKEAYDKYDGQIEISVNHHDLYFEYPNIYFIAFKKDKKTGKLCRFTSLVKRGKCEWLKCKFEIERYLASIPFVYLDVIRKIIISEVINNIGQLSLAHFPSLEDYIKSCGADNAALLKNDPIEFFRKMGKELRANSGLYLLKTILKLI